MQNSGNRNSIASGAVALLGGASTSAALCLGLSYSWSAVVLVALVLIAGTTVCLVPTAWLPAIALVLGILVPVRQLPVPDLLNVITPPLVVICVWAFRRLIEDRSFFQFTRQRASSILGLALLAYCAVCTLTSPFRLNGIVWTASFGLLALLPLFVKVRESEVHAIRYSWVYTGALLGAAAIAEYLLRANPLYGALYAASPFPLEQKWAAYRVTTTLGHPLVNSVFFAVSLAICLGMYTKYRRLSMLLFAILASCGLLLTQSRGGLLAAAVVIILFVLQSYVVRGTTGLVGRTFLILLALVVAIFAYQSPYVTDRVSSREAVVSTDQRYLAYDVAVEVASRYHWLGSGAGTSAPSTQGLGSPTLVIESSYLQLLISIGIPGLAIAIALLGALTYRSFTRRRWIPFFALPTYALSIAFFNFIEANRALHIFLGTIVFMAVVSEEESEVVSSPRSEVKAADADWSMSER